MDSKEKDGAARENAAYVQTIIEQIEKNIKAVKNGTYKFNSPVRSSKTRYWGINIKGKKGLY
ncbi:MAG: hypothetical protein ACLUAO_05765 [Streptococcus sp.]